MYNIRFKCITFVSMGNLKEKKSFLLFLFSHFLSHYTTRVHSEFGIHLFALIGNNNFYVHQKIKLIIIVESLRRNNK